jgi:hypothetical protein
MTPPIPRPSTAPPGGRDQHHGGEKLQPRAAVDLLRAGGSGLAAGPLGADGGGAGDRHPDPPRIRLHLARGHAAPALGPSCRAGCAFGQPGRRQPARRQEPRRGLRSQPHASRGDQQQQAQATAGRTILGHIGPRGVMPSQPRPAAGRPSRTGAGWESPSSSRRMPPRAPARPPAQHGGEASVSTNSRGAAGPTATHPGQIALFQPVQPHHRRLPPDLCSGPG